MEILTIDVLLIFLIITTVTLDLQKPLSEYCTCLQGKYRRSYDGLLEFTFFTGNCSSSAEALYLGSVKMTCMYGFSEEELELDFNSAKTIQVKNDTVSKDGIFTLLYRVALDDCQYRIINISVIKPTDSSQEISDVTCTTTPTTKLYLHVILTLLLLFLIIVIIIACSRVTKRRHRLSQTDDEINVLYHPAPIADFQAKKSTLVITLDYNNSSSLMDLLKLLNSCHELDIVYPEKEARCVSRNTNKWIVESLEKCDCFIIVLSDIFMASILSGSVNGFVDENPMSRVSQQLFLELYETIQYRHLVEFEIYLVYLNAESTLISSFKKKFHKLFCHSSAYLLTSVDSSENNRRQIEELLGRLYHNINVLGSKDNLLSSYIEKLFCR